MHVNILINSYAMRRYQLANTNISDTNFTTRQMFEEYAICIHKLLANH